MQRFEIDMPLDFDLIDHGDTHIGDAMNHTRGLDKVISYVLAEPYRYWIHKGDWIEAITTDDKRFNLDTASPVITPTQQRDQAIELYRPIQDKGVVGLFGNHEAKLQRFGNMAEEICKGLGIRYGTFSCRLIFKHGKHKLFNGFFTHGRWQFQSNAKDYEQRITNMKASLKMRLKYKTGDCAIMSCGHAHKLLVVPPTEQLYLHDTPNGLEQSYLTGKQTGQWIDPDHRWYGCSGSLLKLYKDGLTGYAEMAGYDPVELGCLVWHVRDGIITECERMIL
jgi:hypothetical protein